MYISYFSSFTPKKKGEIKDFKYDLNKINKITFNESK